MGTRVRFVLSALILAGFAAPASADLVTYVFDFEGDAGVAFDGNASASHTVIGALGDLTLNASAVGGNFFVGSAGLGIGNTTFSGSEAMTFSFTLSPPPTSSESFNFSVMTLGSFGGTSGSDTAELTVDGTTYSYTKADIGSALVPVDITFDISDDFEFGASTGTVALRSFAVQIASVPEPTAFLFGSLVAGSVGAVVARRRKRVA